MLMVVIQLVAVNILTPNTAIEVYTEIDPVICKGDSSGYIVAQAGGGFAPYLTYGLLH